MIVNLIKSKNYTISKKADGGGVVVNAFSGNSLITSTVTDKQQGVQSISFADEIITLYDGTILQRVKDNLILYKE